LIKSPSTSGSTGREGEVEVEGDGDGQMEWTRSCRCGAEKGFRILEEELEDAEKRGEKEVLVGCEGCSLWVRVGFEVEEG
jgi:diphthamide biosynthesis protein 4